MEAVSTVVSAQGLQNMLSAISAKDHGTRIRFRAVGQLWYPNFLRVLKFEDGKRILFYDEKRKFYISLRDVPAIAEFELNAKVAEFEANTPYQVNESEMAFSRNALVGTSKDGDGSLT